MKSYLRIFLRSQSYDTKNRDFRERRLAVRLCNPLSGNRDISDGKFSFVPFSLLRIIIHSFMFHLRIDVVQLFFNFQNTHFFSKIGNNLSSSFVNVTCHTPGFRLNCEYLRKKRRNFYL